MISKLFVRSRRFALKAVIVVGTFALCAGLATAATTISGTGVSGNGPLVIDGASTIAIGSSTATGVTIGNGNATTSFGGSVSIENMLPGQIVTGGPTIQGYPDFIWHETPTGVGQRGLQIGSPEPDLSVADGNASAISVVSQGSPIRENTVLATDGPRFIAEPHYFSAGTLQSPSTPTGDDSVSWNSDNVVYYDATW